MMKVRTKTGARDHTALLITIGAATNVHFDGEAFIAALKNPVNGDLPLLFVVLLPGLDSWTENIMGMGRLAHDVTASSGTQLYQFTQPVRGLRHPKITLRKPCSNVGTSRAAGSDRCHVTF